MATINGTQFNDNNTVNGDNKFHKSLVGTDQQWQQGPNGPVLTLGNDVIHGLGGDDIIYGRGGSDDLYGDSGNDNIYGETGNDYLHGGTGNDYLDGGTGNDNLDGGTGNDNLWGEAGNDILTGGAGNDYLNGFSNGTEFDTLTGGANADTFVLGAQSYYNFYTGDGFALITDFNSLEADKIALFETLDKYTLVSGDFGYGNAALDTKILFGNDVIGVLQDTTNVTATDFILGNPFPG
ncbi:calcium-binding protein [Microcoleus sp. B4-D4]|uniref:calcium-binding protein n=1 Tax=Microcoleus sp. B4-D4 TaxID=2818667 RepID=UPI002FD76976